MDIPKAYIRSHYGRNGKPRYDPNRSGENSFGITLFTVMDIEAMKVLPDPNVLTGYPSENSMDIRITNSYSKSARLTDESSGRICITRKQRAMESGLRIPDCTSKKCALILPIDGWLARISIPRDMYLNEPQKHCRLAKDFLDGLTIQRDDIRVSTAIGGRIE